MWTGIALAAALGYLFLGSASPQVIPVITAVAAAAILTMLADTMIPEVFERTQALTGLIAAIGFASAFTISRAGG